MNLNEDTYTKARFYKCALQVNPASYIKYRGQEQSISEVDYNNQLLNAALEAGINVIGLADHGSVDGVDLIRELFTQHGIVVFPGFEIASSEKIHFVCLFDESKTAQELERILGSLKLLDPQDGIRPSRLSAEQLIEEINQQNGFIYAAHCTNDNGILKIGQMNHIWKHKGLLAAQIPGSLDDLRSVESGFYRKAFLNKDVNYKRERKMTPINASDVAKPNDIEKDGASCLVKMTKPCFASFKQAFLDSESRVRLHSDKSENYASAIENIKFVSGYLDGIDIELSEHLNAIIGGRGTGKSTFLECIRFAFDLEPFGKEAKMQHEALIKSNLGNEKGMVEVKVRSAAMHGRKFTISRKFGDRPIVEHEDGSIAPYHPKDLFPNIELYGQNEIYEMTRDEQIRNKLVERFLEDEHKSVESCVNGVLKKLELNREAILVEIVKKHNFESEIEQLPKLLDKVKQYEELGIDEKLEIVSKLEKEKQLSEKLIENISNFKESTLVFKESLLNTRFFCPEELIDLPHEDILMKKYDLINNLAISLTESLVKIEKLSEKAFSDLQPLRQGFLKVIGEEEEKLDVTFKSIPSSQGKTGRQIGIEYQELLKQIEYIKPKEAKLKLIREQISSLYNNRNKLLLELSQKTSLRASTMQKSIKKLNKKLTDKVNLNLISEGNRQIIVDFLLDCKMDGIGARRLDWVKEQEFSTINLSSTIRNGKKELIESFGVTELVANALCSIPKYKILELEEVVVPDTMTIELNVTHNEKNPVYRSINELSTGQQCTAVLHLLLLENNDPLILDQPEDNLDNAFIADRIVTELRKAKLSRQFLFATHNANIPVFGDAEWIGVFSVEDNKGKILTEQQGAIDVPEVQRLAAKILEGGESAFNQRREKYGFS